jgi:hypothetical protein
MAGSSPGSPINLVRPEEADDSARGLFRRCLTDGRVKTWVGTTAAKWLRRDEGSAFPVPPGAAGLPEWAVKVVDGGGVIHRFALSPLARDKLSHIADYLEAVLKAAARGDQEQRAQAEAILESLSRTSVEQAHAHASAWFSLTAREAETEADRRLLKAVAGRQEIAVEGDELVWKLCFPRDLRNVASQLRNCLGNSKYAAEVRDGNAEIWVLTDPIGRVRAAAHLSPRNQRFVEVKAADNKPPAGYEQHIKVLAAARGVKADVWDLKALYLAQLGRLPRLAESGPWAAVHVFDEYAVFRTDLPIDDKRPQRILVAKTVEIMGEGRVERHLDLRTASGLPAFSDLEIVCQGISEAILASGLPWVDLISSDVLPMVLPAEKGGSPGSWRRLIARSREVAGWTVHELDIPWNGAPGPVLVAEGCDTIMHLGGAGRLSCSAETTSFENFWNLVQAIDPRAEAVRVPDVPQKTFTPEHVKTSLGNLPCLPTPHGWLPASEVFRIEGAEQVAVLRLREGPGNSFMTLAVEAGEDAGKYRVVAYMTAKGGLDLLEPSICLDLVKLEFLVDRMEAVAGVRPISLFTREAIDYDPETWMPDAVAPDRSGKHMWSGDTVTAYRTTSRAGRIVAISSDRKVLWQISSPRLGLVSRGSVHSREGVGSLSRFLVEAGLSLEDPAEIRRRSYINRDNPREAPWEAKLTRFGYKLVNGRPMSRANVDLDRVECGDGVEWVRADLRLKKGEDRAWQARVPIRRNGQVYYSSSSSRIELTVTAKREGHLDVGSLTGIGSILEAPGLIDGLMRILDASRMTLDVAVLAALGLKRVTGGHRRSLPEEAPFQEGLQITGAHEISPRWLVLGKGKRPLALVSFPRNATDAAGDLPLHRLSIEVADPTTASAEAMAAIATLLRHLLEAAVEVE